MFDFERQIAIFSPGHSKTFEIDATWLKSQQLMFKIPVPPLISAFTEYFHCARWQAQPLNHLFIPVPIVLGNDANRGL